MKTIVTPPSKVPAAKPPEMWLSKDGFEPVPVTPVVTDAPDPSPSIVNKPAPKPAPSVPPQ